MKTKDVKTRDLPRPLRIMVFICSIVILCLPNWIVLNAGDPTESPSEVDSRIAYAVLETPEQEIELQNWMLCPEEWCDQITGTEPDMRLEHCRLDFHGKFQVTSKEPVIPLEDWMLDFNLKPRPQYAPVLANHAEEQTSDNP